MSVWWAALICSDIRLIPQYGCQILALCCSQSPAPKCRSVCVWWNWYSKQLLWEATAAAGTARGKIGSAGGWLSAVMSFCSASITQRAAGMCRQGLPIAQRAAVPERGKSALWFQFRIRTGTQWMCIHHYKTASPNWTPLLSQSLTLNLTAAAWAPVLGQCLRVLSAPLRGSHPACLVWGSSALIPPRKSHSLQQNAPTSFPASPAQLM